jgi:hypothetical protein
LIFQEKIRFKNDPYTNLNVSKKIKLPQGEFAHNHEPLLMRHFNHSKQFAGRPDTKKEFKELNHEQQKSIIREKLNERINNIRKRSAARSEIEMLTEELLEKLVQDLKSDVSDKNLPLLEDLENQARWCLDK